MNIIKSICKRFCAIILSAVALIIGLFAILLITSLSANAETASDVMEVNSPSDNTEKQIIIEGQAKEWVQTEGVAKQEEATTETKKILQQNANTVKLENVVPPIQLMSASAAALSTFPVHRIIFSFSLRSRRSTRSITIRFASSR